MNGVHFHVLKVLFVCVCVVFLSEADSHNFVVDTLNLNGTWRLRNSNGSLSLNAEVPGCVHTALQLQKLIEDPYYRFNDLAYRWISLDNWTYTTSFSVPDYVRESKRSVLVFEGVDTISTISLNGVIIGNTDNMFLRYDFEVTGLLKDVNFLEVWLMSAVTYASMRHQAHTAYKVPPECPPATQKGECHVNFIRKAQSSFSWDWGPSFPTLGIWKDVYLESFNTFRLLNFVTSSKYDSLLSCWTVEVELFFDTIVASKGIVQLSVPQLQSEAKFQLSLSPGQSNTSFLLQINQNTSVDLWWPFGHGQQPLKELFINISMVGGEAFHAKRMIAFRTVELVQEPIPDSPGLSFYFRINGQPIFLKGSNWIPAHAFQDQATADRLTQPLLSAQMANMNVLRVWGGGIYEQDLFYSLCDKLGIMVWQDFMFACALYPIERDFIQSVRKEVTQQVRRLKSHPSVVIWSGNNENEAAIATNWFFIPHAERPRYVKDYIHLYVENIREIVLQEDSSRPFLVSSPTNGLQSEKEGWVAQNPYDPHYGDVHFYSYLTDCWDWRSFPRTRFASEYGFQSWPSMSTLSKVSTAADWDFRSEFSNHRQHHEFGNWQMMQQAELHYVLPNHTDPVQKYRDTIYITQVMQAQCVKTQTEFYRRSQSDIVQGEGHTMGALYWQLNDVWQAPSWSSIEFGGKWKMLHYWAVNFFSPLISVGVEDKEDLMIYAISDLNLDYILKVSVKLYRWNSFIPQCSLDSDWAVVKGGGVTKVFEHPVSPLLKNCGNCTRQSCVVTFHLSGPEHGIKSPPNHLFLSSPRDAKDLQKPKITFTVEDAGERFMVTLHSSSPALFVWLDVEDIPGLFDANGFLMISEQYTVYFTAWTFTTLKDFTSNLHVTTLRDIY
ncbi:beta-mannosidase [Electrophorus electricus]|uniref:Beta-mannosidase n=1 Tax=Electrophorus electricus TaxID=8005 RepID=A0A4W4GJ98_ELEEL|nr:beta-mannosidase [Electrophorus electricus]